MKNPFRTKEKDFVICSSDVLGKLSREIEDFIKVGFELRGGIRINANPTGHKYFQAMIYPGKKWWQVWR